MIKFSSSFKVNEIHMVIIALSTKIPKYNFFFQGGPNFGERRPEYLGKMGNNRHIYCYANREAVNFKREYKPIPPDTKILVMPHFFCMPHQILGKNENSIFRPGSSPSKI